MSNGRATQKDVAKAAGVSQATVSMVLSGGGASIPSETWARITKAAKDTTSTPTELQKTDSQAFQDLADGYQARATVISNAGAPPGVDDGAKKQKDAVKQLTTLSTAYADLKKQVDELNTKDQGKFASGLKEVSTQMEKVETQRKTAFASLRALEEGDIKKALAEQSGCKQVSASAPATNS